jgi:probable HAF family extracellular repeat protein
MAHQEENVMSSNNIGHALLGPRFVTFIAFAFVSSACARDAVAPPLVHADLALASAVGTGEVITTEIIPAVRGVFPDAPNGEATAINEAGVVVGWKRTATEFYAFMWKDGTLTSLGTAYPLRNENMDKLFVPVAINRSEEVAGNNASGQAVVWRNGALTTLATSAGRNRRAYDMNDKGQVVGSATVLGQSTTEAFVWDKGSFTELGTLGGSSSVATKINNHGQVVGYSQIAGDTAVHAFIWERGLMTDLGTMEGGSSRAFGINDKGEVVGLTSHKYSAPLPFIWRKGVMIWMLQGQVSDLAFYSITDISDAGHVVGYRSDLGDSYAFVWRDGVDIDVGGGLTYAMSVNSSGVIAGYESPSIGAPGAYLWTVGRRGP